MARLPRTVPDSASESVQLACKPHNQYIAAGTCQFPGQLQFAIIASQISQSEPDSDRASIHSKVIHQCRLEWIRASNAATLVPMKLCIVCE